MLIYVRLRRNLGSGTLRASIGRMRHLCAILVWLLLGVCRTVSAQNASSEIPFEFRDGFLWIDVAVPQSPKPLKFLLDSGAQVSVIDTRTAQRLGVKHGRQVKVEAVGSTTKGFWPQTLNAHAGKVQLPRDYLMLDLQKLSQSCTNARVDGIIGADFFRNRIVQIDYQRQKLRLLQAPPAKAEMQELPLKVRRCGMIVPVQINNSKPQWLRLDTGCASAVHWVTGNILPGQCTRRVAVALAKVSVSTTQTTVTLGGARFDAVPTDVHPKEIFPGEKGLLGNGMLCRFKTVTIDAKNGKLFLGPVWQ